MPGSMPQIGEKTYYDILGVKKDASQDELRKAWLALARKYHPDKTGGHRGSEERLKVVNEAYDTLKRPEKRRQYDESLSGSFETEGPFGTGAAYGGSPRNGSDKPEKYEFHGEFADFFGDLFGQKSQGRQRGPRPGRDLEAQVTVSLKEAATGTTRSLRLPSFVPCQACSGSGAAPGTKSQQCPKCNGAGHISSGQGSFFVLSQMCPLCRGRGEIIATPCPSCEGSGFKTEARTLSVAVPAGVRTGTRLRLAAQGEPGDPGAPGGDLFVVVVVVEDALFQLKRNDVICEVPITFTQAVLGGTVEIPALHGKARLKIPAGTQPGAILRMRGQGFPSLDGGHSGDQLVTIIVEIPKTITQEQRKVIHDFLESSSLDAYPKHRIFSDNLKRWGKE